MENIKTAIARFDCVDPLQFLADGQIIGEMNEPTSEAVFDYMKTLGD